MAIEKINYEDAYVMEIMVDKLNEIIDAINEIDARLTQRMDNHMKYHRFLSKRLETTEDKLGIPHDKR